MSIKELREKKYYIILEALLKGIQLNFKNGWNIFFSKGQVYQTYYSREHGEQVTHRSDVTLQSFLQHFEGIKDSELKQIYANIKLQALQDKLLND